MAYVAKAAERECRTVAAQMRYLATGAMRRDTAGKQPAAPAREPWPPPLPTVTRDNLPETKALVVEWETERDALTALSKKRRSFGGLQPHQADRLSWLHNAIGHIGNTVRIMEGKPR
jgi:hypothetical protein